MQLRETGSLGRVAVVAGVVVSMLWAGAGVAAEAAATMPGKKAGFEAVYPAALPLGRTIGRAADAALDTAAGGDFGAGVDQADAAFLLACAYGTSKDLDAFREAAFARRLLGQLGRCDEGSRGELLGYLRAHPAVAHTLVFAVRDGDHVRAVYELFDRLRRERPGQVERFPELTAALCVVRSHPRRAFSEPGVQEAAPLDVFDFYVAHEGQMFYGLRGVPVELLVYVIDNPLPIQEMNWALARYGGTRDVGALFFTISYDYDFYYGKADQKLHAVAGGYTLANILKVGGICADQAYFATAVGKSIGIPSAWTDGDSALSGHAWVGYLRSNGRSAAWDFRSGRYTEYQVVRGNVTDPQTGKSVADSTVSLLGDLIGSNAVARQDAVALVDAAKAWGATDGKAEGPPAYPAEALAAAGGKAPAARPTSAEGQLELIEIGLRQFAAYPRGWEVVADLAREGKLSEAQKRRWADVTQRMCGQQHVDFALSILEPMVETVSDGGERVKMWEAIFAFVQARPDLAAHVRLRQAKAWEEQKDLARAGQCYESVLRQYINAGPFALAALGGAESVLKQMGQEGRVLALYAEAAKLVKKPDQLSGRAEFIKDSNWYKVREAYAGKLEKVGQSALAAQVRAEDAGAGK